MYKNIEINGKASVTQSAGAVLSLLKYLGKSIEPLPESVELQDMVLVLSSKKDVYYNCTKTSCSCPSATYRPGQRCKHQRKYFPENSIKRQSLAKTLDEADKNLERMPARYQRMVLAAREASEGDPESIAPKGKWPGGFNGPVDPEIIATEKAKRQQEA